MTVFILSFVVFALAVSGLSIGLLAGRGGIRGTCGGLNQADGCGLCGRGASEGPRECPKRHHEVP
jgi:hypothetical protein